jgi:hypothetical protein
MTFLHNHAKDWIAVDFFVISTATFRVLYVFVILAHERRKFLHFNITDSPSAVWTAQQLTESTRRESLNYVIVLHEQHSRQQLTDYLIRTHSSLDEDSPESRAVAPRPGRHHRPALGQRSPSPLRPPSGRLKRHSPDSI